MNTLLLAAASFGPTATKATGKATAAAAAGSSSGGLNEDGVMIALGAFGVLLVLGLVGYVVLRMVQKKDDKEYEEKKFVPQRRWSWELGLSDAEEAALMQGLKAWENNERSLYLSHEDGTATLYLTGRQVLVSLFLLGERLRGLGAAGQDPAAVGRLLDELSAQEQPGVVSFSESWFAGGDVDGMNHDAFLSRVRDTLTAGFDGGLPGSNGWYSDENYGRIDLRMIADPSPEIHRLQAEERFDLIPVEESKVKNVLLFNVGPLAERYRRLRADQPALSPEGAIRNLLVETLSQKSPDFTWSRCQATPREVTLLQASAAGQTSI